MPSSYSLHTPSMSTFDSSLGSCAALFCPVGFNVSKCRSDSAGVFGRCLLEKSFNGMSRRVGGDCGSQGLVEHTSHTTICGGSLYTLEGMVLFRLSYDVFVLCQYC